MKRMFGISKLLQLGLEIGLLILGHPLGGQSKAQGAELRSQF